VRSRSGSQTHPLLQPSGHCLGIAVFAPWADASTSARPGRAGCRLTSVNTGSLTASFHVHGPPVISIFVSLVRLPLSVGGTLNPRTTARLVGGAIVLLNLWLVGHYRIEGVMVLVLTFGVAVAFELLIVRPLTNGEEPPETPTATSVPAVAPEPRAAARAMPLVPSEENWKRAVEEFEGNRRREGLWGKSFAEANGNEAVAKAKYLQVRAAELAEADLADAQETARVVEAKRLAQEEAVRLAAQREYDAKPKGICPSCKGTILLNAIECPKCHAMFGAGAAWKVLPLGGET
jgi:hypothetical protein